LELNPLELNNLYEHLYDLGKKLQSDESMVVFEDGFRPWPHVFKPRGRSAKFYGRVDANLTEDLARIRNFTAREDSLKYCKILRDVLRCFGIGIIDSLEFTMKHYIKQTEGDLCNSKREEWEKEAVLLMVCHNNYAERPFAVVKALARMYPSLSLRDLSLLTHSLVNGTHRCAEIFGRRNGSLLGSTRQAGIALTAHPALRKAVNILCSVRRKSPGAVTKLCRDAHRLDTVAHIQNRKAKALAKYAALVQQQATKAAKRDHAEMIASSSLCIDLEDLDLQLKARSNSKEARVTFLKEQVYARISGEQQRLYPNLGSEFRKLGGKLRISSKSKSQSDEDYLSLLVAAMIKEDKNTLGLNENLIAAFKQDYIRVLPSITPEFTNPKAIALKWEFAKTIADQAQPQDDPMYVQLHTKYCGSILYDNETRASQKLFRISAIQFVRSYSKSRHTCWEATCEPVFFCTASGAFVVPQDKRVEGSHVIQANALVGYALTEYPDGLDSEPAHLPWVDNYIAHFKVVVAPSCELASLPAAATSACQTHQVSLFI
jgi:hypothetical protein